MPATLVAMFEDQTSNADSTATDFYATVIQVRVWGTFDSAQVEFKIYDSNRADYVILDSTNAVFTAEGSANIEIPNPSKIRATLSSAGASTSLSATVTPVR